MHLQGIFLQDFNSGGQPRLQRHSVKPTTVFSQLQRDNTVKQPKTNKTFVAPTGFRGDTSPPQRHTPSVRPSVLCEVKQAAGFLFGFTFFF